MNNFTIKKYDESYYSVWNQFVSEAKNATFLFHRDFMEYHSDRFEDYSLLVFEGEKLVAVLPANKKENVVYSHQGLTYGGLVLKERIKLKQVITIFKNVLFYLNQEGIEKLQIKQIPFFYCDSFSDELEYCLFLTNAILIRRDSLSTIDFKKPFFIAKTRKENINRGKRKGLKIVEENNFELFWNKILIPNLNTKHQATPVHTVAEISLLKKKFPESIRHFNVYHNDEIVAGTTVFITKNVAHPQYVSGNCMKNELGSLDYLYHHLITTVFNSMNYFDFGISNEENGRKLNEGLVFWKESFGAKTVTQDFYEVSTSNYKLLENVLV